MIPVTAQRNKRRRRLKPKRKERYIFSYVKQGDGRDIGENEEVTDGTEKEEKEETEITDDTKKKNSEVLHLLLPLYVSGTTSICFYLLWIYARITQNVTTN